MYKKLNILFSGLALVLAMGCNGSTPTPKKGGSGAPVKHANKPGELDLSGVDMKDNYAAKENFAIFYLLAASNSPSPFLEKYAQTYTEGTPNRGIPKSVQKSVEAIIKYIRAGGNEKEVKDIKAQIKGLGQLPYSIFESIPGRIEYQGDELWNCTKSVHTFCYGGQIGVNINGANSFSTAALFAAKPNVRKNHGGSETITQTPLEKLIQFTDPPAVVMFKMRTSETKYDKDITVSTKITLPAACTTTQKKGVNYKLMGAMGGKSIYFCWKGKQWYKIDLAGDDFKPQKVDKQAVLDTGKKIAIVGQLTPFTYVYDMSKGGGKKQGK